MNARRPDTSQGSRRRPGARPGDAARHAEPRPARGAARLHGAPARDAGRGAALARGPARRVRRLRGAPAAAGAPGDLPGESRQAVQHDVPPLPRGRGSGPDRRDDGGRRRRSGDRRHRGEQRAYRRHHGRRARAASALPRRGRSRGTRWQTRHGPLQPDGPAAAAQCRARGLARGARRRDRGLAPPLPQAQHRRPARRRRLRALDPGAAAAQCGGLRQGRSAPPPDGGIQSRRGIPGGIAGNAGEASGSRRSPATPESRSIAFSC